MQLYDITLTTSQTRQLDAPGSYFYYYAGSAGGADATITLRGLSSGLRIILKPGQAFRLPNGTIENAWVMTNYAGTSTIIGTVIVGNGDITDNRVTGSVEVIDGGKNRTLANQAFIGYGYANAAAGNYSYTQLWNPSNSGKRIVIEQITSGVFVGTVPVVMNFAMTNAVFATSASNAQSKLTGGVNSVMEIRTDTNVNSGSTRFPTRFWDQYVEATSRMWDLQPKEPIVVTPGYGIVISCGNVNTAFTTNIEFYEEANT
jgi:hypothetical protein